MLVLGECYDICDVCLMIRLFLSDGIINFVGDYNSSRVGVVCRLSCDVCPKFQHGIISKRFELEG